MKRKDLEKTLRKYNWRFARHGGRHDFGLTEKSTNLYRDILKLMNIQLKKY